MSANFFLKSISFKNYRGLKKLNIPSFRRINVIGGFNGAGKSTLLEGIFFLYDRRGPVALTRPYVWRQIAFGGRGSLDQYFSGLDLESAISIDATTSNGRLAISMAYGPTPTGVTVQIPNSSMRSGSDRQQAGGGEIGLNIQAKIDGQPDDAAFALPLPDGIAVTAHQVGRSRIPPATLLTPQTRNAAQENAERFSVIVKDRRLPELLKVLSVVNQNIRGIQLLQEGGGPVLNAELVDGMLRPIPMLGDGLQTLLSIALAIMTSSGGAVLLDEFDAAIHYSVLAETWANIAGLANQYNCQIFAVTHSLECIRAALEGVKKGSRIEDFLYLRLEKDDFGVSSVPFDGGELGESLDSDWEIR